MSRIDWAERLATLCRYYPGYTLERAADELTIEQLNALLSQVNDRPWDYACMVEPPKGKR